MAEIIVDNSVTEITVTTDKSGPQGPQGNPGTPGADGVGISSIAKTATVGLVDTYTITYTDGTTSTFEVTNGADGAVESVNGQTGAVVLDADDVGALPDNTPIPANTSDLNNDSGFITSESDPVFSASAAAGIDATDITAWNNKSDFSGSYNDLTDKPTIPAAGVPSGGTTGQVLAKKTNTNYDLEWVNQSGGGGAVDSVNGQTGTVVLDASDVGALPDTYTAPVTSVNTKTGAVTLTASDVGALSSSTTFVSSFNGSSGAVTYTAPVTSVNGATGAVSIGNATTLVAGLMSATDKSHLDDVYADYSSALTALGVS